MSDEFKKLDALMERNRPIAVPRKRELRLPEKKSWTGVFVALGISAIITVGVVKDHRTKMENAVYMSEVLEWDVTSDELPEELENQFAMAD